jgi:pyruvate,water dikinase
MEATSLPLRDKPPEPGTGDAPAVVALDDQRARDPAWCGSKAANLARAMAAGLPVLPGFVLTTGAHVGTVAEVPGLRAAYATLSRGGTETLVVRSSSTVEDAGTSSMAGQFRSVLGVRGEAAFAEAVRTVLASAGARPSPAMPMAVLVQPELASEVSGVLFGVDPVTGDARRLVVEAVAGGPDRLVSGRVTAARYVLGRRGRVVRRDAQTGDVVLGSRQRRALARLARRARRAFGGPQDVEWAYDGGGTLWLLQSRPVTATGAAPTGGPVLGPGPVAETFPDPLFPLEEDLWVGPLRAGVATALRVSRAASPRAVAASPVVTVVGGRICADLGLFGIVAPHRGPLAVLDPRPGARRLRAAWRVGRLRAALPVAVARLIEGVDAWLATVPAPADATSDQLVALLDRLDAELESVHAHEVLAGALTGTLTGDERPAAASLALRALAAGRRAGWTDDELVHRSPVVLSLVPPAIATLPPLPAVPPNVRAGGAPVLPGPDDLGLRDALRLRARWLQELGARTALELGQRLAETGVLDDPAEVRLLRRAELLAAVTGTAPPGDPAGRLPSGPPLPAAFRLAPDGTPVAAERRGSRPQGGTGAGGGRAEGPVHQLEARTPPPAGAVLVVRTLDPGLAPLLPGLAGLVAETGSTLSHLAILAREYHVPTVVGVHGALGRFAPGCRLLVDGTTGEVVVVEPAPAAGAGATPAGEPVPGPSAATAGQEGARS